MTARSTVGCFVLLSVALQLRTSAKAPAPTKSELRSIFQSLRTSLPTRFGTRTGTVVSCKMSFDEVVVVEVEVEAKDERSHDLGRCRIMPMVLDKMVNIIFEIVEWVLEINFWTV